MDRTAARHARVSSAQRGLDVFDVRHVYRPLTSRNLLDSGRFGTLEGQCDRLSRSMSAWR
jgi:hypothetical protein